MKRDWIVGYGGSVADGIYQFDAKNRTKEEMMQALVRCCKDVRHFGEAEADAIYECGTESATDVEVRDDGSLYAYVCFDTYHVDIEATPIDTLGDWPY